MSEQVSRLLILSGIVLGLLLMWAVTIGITYWDASRRKLKGGELAAWMALVALIPVLGFIAYLFSRLLGAFLSPDNPASEPFRRRITLIKRQLKAEPRTGTLLAADIKKPTLPAASPLPKTSAMVKQGTPKVRLAVTDGPQAGREYALNSLPVRIGRGREAAIRLDEDLGVSRQHAEIYEQAGVLRIRDLKSTHGTHVNGFSIDDKSLDPGDRIQVGVSTLVVRIHEEMR